MPCQRLNLQCRRTSEKKKEDHLHISVFLLGVQRKAADACVFLPFMMAHDHHTAARYFGVVTSFTVAETFTTYSAASSTKSTSHAKQKDKNSRVQIATCVAGYC